MPRIAVNSHVPSLYLETWKPQPGRSYRVSVLDPNPFCTLGHWLSSPDKGIQGRYECQGASAGGHALCCEAFPPGTPGAAGFQFSIPVFVYYDPTKDATGEFKAWAMTQNFYKNSFQIMALTNDLLQYDIEVSARAQGQGTQLTATVVTSVKMRDYQTQEIKADIEKNLASFYSMGDRNFVKQMTPESWQNILVSMGYDFVNKVFPPGMGTQSKFGNSSGSLASLNSPGYIPPVPQAPAVASVPPVVQALPAQPAQSVVQTIPAQQVTSVQSVPPIQSVQQPIQSPSPVSTVAVPVGTYPPSQPVVPSVSQPAVGLQQPPTVPQQPPGVPQQPPVGPQQSFGPPPNATVASPAVQSISKQELDEILEGL
jgi:hypothetical protein